MLLSIFSDLSTTAKIIIFVVALLAIFYLQFRMRQAVKKGQEKVKKMTQMLLLLITIGLALFFLL
jgi:membrane protein insertase Oxa1/YidC/SpoIIIJ